MRVTLVQHGAASHRLSRQREEATSVRPYDTLADSIAISVGRAGEPSSDDPRKRPLDEQVADDPLS